MKIVEQMVMPEEDKGEENEEEREFRREEVDDENEDEDKDECRQQRFTVSELPNQKKTINKAFGSLKHFLFFFQSREPGIQKFAEQLQEAEATQNLRVLNSKILPQIVSSISKESIKVTDNEAGLEKLAKLLQKKCKSITHFYRRILRAYTLETFLYRHLNLYLRTQNWTELHCLLPYTFSLFKALIYLKLAPPSRNQPVYNEDDAMIILTRGMRLDESSLSLYNLSAGSILLKCS